MIQFLLCKMMYVLGLMTGLALIVAVVSLGLGILFNIAAIATLPLRLIASCMVGNNDENNDENNE